MCGGIFFKGDDNKEVRVNSFKNIKDFLNKIMIKSEIKKKNMFVIQTGHTCSLYPACKNVNFPAKISIDNNRKKVYEHLNA